MPEDTKISAVPLIVTIDPATDVVPVVDTSEGTTKRVTIQSLVASAGNLHNHDALYYTESETDALLAAKAALSHTHAISSTTGLQSALDAKAALSHTHAISDTTGLQAAIDSKAATSHTHAISDTTALQAALDAKAATSHTHAASDLASGTVALARLPVAPDGVTSSTALVRADDVRLSASGPHNHDDRYYTESEADALLAAKAASSHTHAIADTTGLQAALDGKAATAHTHAAADVTSGTLDIARLPVATSGTSNATQVPRADDSRLSNSRTPNGSASGDLSGTYPSPVVAKIQGRGVASTAPTNGQALAWDNTTSQWKPTTISGGGGSDATSIQTVPVSGTSPTNGQALRYNSTSSQWEPSTLGTAAVADTSSAVFNTSSIQSVTVSASAPSNGQAIRYNSTSSQWEPTNLGSAADAATGDAVFNASAIQSTAVSVTAPSNGQTLVFNSTSSQWEPSTPAGGGSGDLLSTNNLSDVANAATARTNLGLAIGTNVQAYNAATAFTNVAQSFTQGQRGAISTLTDGATITPNFNSANNFTVTLAGNRTLANPTNVTAGQSGSIFILQDGTGSRTLAYGANWDFANGAAPTLSTPASAIDRLDYIARSSTSIHAVLTKAYA